MDDLEDILRTEEKIEKEQNVEDPERMGHLKDTAVYHLQHGDPLMNLGAEIDNQLVGFIFSEIRLWEFGRAEKTGGKANSSSNSSRNTGTSLQETRKSTTSSDLQLT